MKTGILLVVLLAAGLLLAGCCCSNIPGLPITPPGPGGNLTLPPVAPPVTPPVSPPVTPASDRNYVCSATTDAGTTTVYVKGDWIRYESTATEAGATVTMLAIIKEGKAYIKIPPELQADAPPEYADCAWGMTTTADLEVDLSDLPGYSEMSTRPGYDCRQTVPADSLFTPDGKVCDFDNL